MCSSGDSSQEFLCSTTIGASSDTLARTLQAPEAVIQYGLTLQNVGFPVFLAAGGVLFTLGIILFLLLKMTSRAQTNSLDPYKSQRLPARKARFADNTIRSLWLSSAISLTVAYATTLTLSSILLVEANNQLAIQITRGTALEALQWAIFSLSALFSLGITRLIQQTGLGPSPGQQPGGLPSMSAPPLNRGPMAPPPAPGGPPPPRY